ncbi:hypothetical protein AA12717_3460 [Gluconacetobacter sacchari DSM 12717]|uniref:Uncharacterized protein n=2 Tax=Gluconacetobacter sacchari TaxID=92759 RepID=A0A7W4ICG4_9PROT|nr:hypothetical protein [Gluconacetobacter sacchari]MBB2160174.1 hypothetical protein [Gluconacetobacter sacchari]GBQ30276.1 hypothetical protein AA12717_3460 [Gluconacetobacter sacchari DSM 12717]
MFPFRSLLPGVALLHALLAVPPRAMARPALQAPVQAFDPDLIQHDPDGRVYLSVRDAYGILTAMEHGDIPRLHAIRDGLDRTVQASSASYAIMAGLCDAALARVRGGATCTVPTWCWIAPGTQPAHWAIRPAASIRSICCWRPCVSAT